MLVKSVIKDIQSLALKKHREQTGCYIAEGPKLVEELLLHHRQQIVSLYALPEWIEANWPFLLAGALLAGAAAFVVVYTTSDSTPAPMLRFRPGGAP